MALTALQIKHAKEGMHADGNGLYLRVQASGAKSWIFRFQLKGKRREMGIGTLDHRSPTEARSEAARLVSLVRSGIDPIEQRKHDEAASIAAAQAAKAHATTFDEAAAEYIANHKAGWKNAKHSQQWENTIAAYASPIIGNKPVGEVSTEDVLRILRPIWTSKTETASRLRSRIELILSYAKAMKWRQGENPAMWRGHLDALLAPAAKVKNVRHHPALPYDQAPEFLSALRMLKGAAARALEFSILTATRSGEARLAQWGELDLEARLWTIPANRMKAKREHWVPLSDQVISLIKSLPKIGGNDYLFPGDRDKKPLSDMTLTAIIRRMNKCEEGQQPKWIDPKTNAAIVPHGFRSTFRDWSAEIGHFPRELAEHALAHSLPDKVEAAYHRGTMLERRRPMMQWWADYLDKKKADVIPLGTAA